MKKISLTFIFVFLFFNYGYAATGEATQYKVTMEKVELCEDSACATSVTVGETDSTVDIASADAGADVGNYASTTGLPLGKTYTHLRVTVSRTFTVTGTVTAGGSECATDGGTDHDADHLLDAGTGTATSTSMYLSDADGYAVSDGDNDADQIVLSYSSPTYATTMTISGDSVLLIYELTAPYTAKFKAPLITVSFGTKNAVGANETSCVMWLEEPLVAITLK